MSHPLRASAKHSEPPDPASVLAADVPAYTDFARVYARSRGVTDAAEILAVADDAVQNAWIALRANDAFDPQQAAAPWVKQHIRTEVKALLRPKKTKDGQLRHIRTAALEARMTAAEDDVYAFLSGAGDASETDGEAIDQEQALRWVDTQVSPREREMLRLYSLGHTGAALAERLNASPVSGKTTRTGTVTVQLHRLLKRLAKGYTASLRTTDPS